MIEIVLIGVILLFLFNYLGAIQFNTFVADNKAIFSKLKESDYDFYLDASFGEKVEISDNDLPF